MASNDISVQEYKKYFENNFKKNNYQIALFIDFLTKKGKLIREIGELTGLKESQIHCYKKIIKLGKVNELQTTAFRLVLKSCNGDLSSSAFREPEVEDNIVKEIEKLNSDNKTNLPPRNDIRSKAHYFNNTEYLPGKSTYIKKDYCPCGVDIGGCSLPGQREVHIPRLGLNMHTFLKLQEAVEHADQIEYLKNKITKLEAENRMLKEQNERLRS